MGCIFDQQRRAAVSSTFGNSANNKNNNNNNNIAYSDPRPIKSPMGASNVEGESTNREPDRDDIIPAKRLKRNDEAMGDQMPDFAADFATRFLAARAQLMQHHQQRLLFANSGSPKPVFPAPLPAAPFLLLQQQLTQQQNANKQQNHFSQLLQIAHLQSYLSAIAAATTAVTAHKSSNPFAEKNENHNESENDS